MAYSKTNFFQTAFKTKVNEKNACGFRRIVCLDVTLVLFSSFPVIIQLYQWFSTRMPRHLAMLLSFRHVLASRRCHHIVLWLTNNAAWWKGWKHYSYGTFTKISIPFSWYWFTIYNQQLFKTIGNHPSLMNASMIIFFNKKDIFREKLFGRSRRHHIAMDAFMNCFPDYCGTKNYKEMCNFILNKVRIWIVHNLRQT
jgi:hypothetical protein